MRGNLTILICFIAPFFIAQNPSVDSLEQALSTEQDLSKKLETIHELVKFYGDNVEAELYVKTALDLTKKSSDSFRCDALDIAFNYYNSKDDLAAAYDYKYNEIQLWTILKNPIELGEAHFDLAKSFIQTVQMDSATVHLLVARDLFEDQKEWESLAKVLNKMGVLQKDIENYAEALKLYHEAYKICSDYGLMGELASTSTNIGVVLKKEGQLSEALEYYEEALGIYFKEQNYFGMANIYNNIGNVLRIEGKYDEALSNYKLAIENRKLGDSEKTLSFSYNNIAIVFTELNQLDSALFYLKISEDYKLKLGEESTLSSTYLNYANVYSRNKDSANFYLYFRKAEESILTYNRISELQELYMIRSKFESEMGNYELAYQYLMEIFTQLDTLDKKNQILLGQMLQAKFKDQQKEDAILALEKSNTLLDQQKKQLEEDENRFRMMSFGLIFVSIILLVVLLILLRNFNVLKNNSEELSTINKELEQTKLGSEEKDVLIKEIHHRVKNNLQIIKSLIRLQNASIEDHGINDILVDFENRVASMALVHESLYKSLDLSKVSVTEYYEKLLNDLVNAYTVDKEILRDFSIEIDNFGINTLIPLGLLTNEIVSNALKHGFEGVKSGKITVRIWQISDLDYEMYIGDNGVGMHERFLSKQSLGMELIDTLVQQLDGSMERIVKDGTYYKIKFRSQDNE